MKIVGLITEYNPFHNGHKYHIKKAKEITGADYCIAVMSGDFVQRGAPAFMPKHIRAEMALRNGCDMVLELPVYFATGSAEFFASGAISILDKLQCVDAICFGSECGDYSLLNKIAEVLIEEPAEFKTLLQKYLKDGYNFPVARKESLKKYFKDDSLDKILDEPNNILGIEYMKAMRLNNSSMKGYTIRRKGSSYHNHELSECYSSASAIRNFILNENFTDFQGINGHIPNDTLDLLFQSYHSRFPVVNDDFSLLLRYKLLSENQESLCRYADISPDLANRIIKHRNTFTSYTQFCDVLKTKDITYSRISRCLIHVLLNIPKTDIKHVSYAHVLGFKKESSELFTLIKKSSKIPLITKLPSLDSSELNQNDMLKNDIYASDLYETIISHKYKKNFINEYTKQIVKI